MKKKRFFPSKRATAQLATRLTIFLPTPSFIVFNRTIFPACKVSFAPPFF